jgi:FlaA1/EpsC-like NDP-sugar epimerase
MLNNSNHSSVRKKFLAVVALDGILLPFSLWTAFALRFSALWPDQIQGFWWLFVVCPFVAFPIFIRHGLYRAILAYMSTKAFYAIIKAVTLHVLVLLILAMVFGIQEIPLTVFAVYWFVALTLVGGSRAVLRSLLQWLNRTNHSSTNVAIYGAGSAGAELAESLQAGLDFNPVAFIDDKHELHGTEIRGLKVYSTKALEYLIENFGVRQVFLAIPSAPHARRKEIVNYLRKLPVHVRTVPSLTDIVSGRSRLVDLREIDIEDILGRDPVPPDERLLSACIMGKSVMVTGSGGSIGSELCRQIVELQPSRVVLFEHSEFALYNIERELREKCKLGGEAIQDLEIIPVLGTVTNQHKLELVLKTFNVQTLYHAAAYKHVPLVEYNPIEGVRNNVFGTYYAAKAALEAKVEKFILISSDKAVRPTNVMGATKRLSELVIQGMARQFDTSRFSMVRFGNVLDSSGSVVPLFRQQIKDGGPITLTHPEMTRYFMTIPEAAQLVIQAGSMGQGGDVFVLDMGDPVYIYDLARQMVSLCGFTVRDASNPHGDISIEMTNLRPGEKLHEELLIGDNVTGTEHPRIMRAQEIEIPWEQVKYFLEHLEIACANDNSGYVIKLLKEAVGGYMPQNGIEDLVWVASQPANKAHDKRVH